MINMGNTVGDIGKDSFRKFLRIQLQKTDDSIIDENIDFWFDKYKGEKYLHASKTIKGIIEPSIWKPREKEKITGICLGSVDKPKFNDVGGIDGVKDNEVTHCILTDDGMIQISDRGTPDIMWGHEYTFDCISGENQSGKKWYAVNDDVPPVETRVFSDDEVMNKLNAIAKPIMSLEHGEIAAVKVKMTHRIYALQNAPLFVSTDSGIQLRLSCSGCRYENNVTIYMSFFINPQQFGEQHFKGMFSDHFYSSLKNAEGDEEVEGIIREWIVPDGDLEVIVVGRVGIKDDPTYGKSCKMSPVYMMMLDMSKFDVESYIESRVSDMEKKPDEIVMPQEDIDIYIKTLKSFGGEAYLQPLTDEIVKVTMWSQKHVEHLTNYMTAKGIIKEPTLGTIVLSDGVEPEEESKQSTVETRTLKIITDKQLEAYLNYNENITVEELNDLGYEIMRGELERAREKMYPKGNTLYAETELKTMKVADLKDICPNYNIDPKGLKKDELIKKILEAQGK
jgi:hypothetical protein